MVLFYAGFILYGSDHGVELVSYNEASCVDLGGPRDQGGHPTNGLRKDWYHVRIIIIDRR